MASARADRCPSGREAGDVTAFVAGEHGSDGAAEEAAALATLKAWLSEVPQGSVGLLSIG